MYRIISYGWPINGHRICHAAFHGVIKMNEELSRDIQRNMVHICDAFATLEFAYRNYDGNTNSCDLASIIGAATHSGMTAFERLSAAIDKVKAK